MPMGVRRVAGSAARVILARRTVRRRLAVLYGVLFLVSGALLLAITGGLAVRSTTQVGPARGAQRTPQTALSQANARIARLQHSVSVAVGQANAAARHQLLIGGLIGLGVMSVLSVVLGLVVAGRVLRPLRDMTATTRRISADNLHERLAMPGPRDELKDLADTIDGLLERLEGSFAAQRRFVANASHELRTPLATMRASLDVAVAKPGVVPDATLSLAGRLRTELDQVDRLLDGFLILARVQHGALPAAQPVALGDVVAAAMAAQADGIAARGLTVRTESTPAGWVDGSPALLHRMVGNVLDNAVQHNVDGGWIQVSTGAGPADRGESVWLVVETSGPVLDPEQVARLGQPFQRLAADRTGGGTGLGLSIVAAVAAVHGGQLTLAARPAGGLWVGIELPTGGPGPAGDRA